MLSKLDHSEKVINLKRSNLLTVILLFATGLALLSVFIMLRVYPLALVFLPGILYYSYRSIKRDCLLLDDQSIVAIELLPDSKWHLINKTGESFHLTEIRRSVRTVWFTILYFNMLGKRSTVVIAFDSVLKSQYQLLVASLL